MATRIVRPKSTASRSSVNPPDLDTVLVWLTRTIQADYATRQVFPALRSDSAVRHNATGASLHFATPDEAVELLGDAEHQQKVGRKGFKGAYGAHANNIRESIAEATTRRALYEATEAVKINDSDYREEWRGTKEQLQALSIGVGCDFPGDGDNDEQLLHTTNARGWSTRVKLHSPFWPGLFVAKSSVPMPLHTGREIHKVPETPTDREIERLKRLPQDPEEFRKHAADSFWNFANIACQSAFSNSDGFAFTVSTLEGWKDAITEAYWVIRNGDVEGRRPAEKLRRILCARAASDRRFQSMLGEFARKNV